jgi:sugar phosphate isomerase/epimerase
VQLADRQAQRTGNGRCSLGQGSVPFRAWLNQFRNCGYRGPWEIETPCFSTNQGVNRCVLQPVLDFLDQPQPHAQVSWPSQL